MNKHDHTSVLSTIKRSPGWPDIDDSVRKIVAFDLFAGAGGFSEALKQVCCENGWILCEAAINHWAEAVESHIRNHPTAHQYHSKVEQLDPIEVLRELRGDGPDDSSVEVDVDLLVGGPQCTYFSKARGDSDPPEPQPRSSPWLVLEYIQRLAPTHVIIENVEEIQNWKPWDADESTPDGVMFDAWVRAINNMGYSVDWDILTASDYGDPTDRDRFFLVASKEGKPTFPEPTHGPEGDEPRRTANEIIDWSDLGTSIWTRDVTHPRVHTPPKQNTMERIAEGLRRYCSESLEPFADALGSLGREEIKDLRRNRVVPYEYRHAASQIFDRPFLVAYNSTEVAQTPQRPNLVKYYGTSPPKSADDPLDTVAADGGHYALSSPVTTLLRQQDGAHPIDVSERAVPTIPGGGGHSIATAEAVSLVIPRNGRHGGLHSNSPYQPDERPFHTVTAKNHDGHLVRSSLVRYSHGGAALSIDDPMPTIATERGGVFALSNPHLTPLYNSRATQRLRTRQTDRPLMTVPASKSPAAVTSPVVEPFIDDYESSPLSLDEPLNTITSKDRFALCIPEISEFGLDIKYRMLQPRELKAAHSFPDEYTLVGTKADRTKQIGNSVPVNLAKSVIEHTLTTDSADLSSFGGGLSEDPDVEIPSYSEAISDD